MSKEQFLKGKKILFTSYSFASFGGAELNAVELAEQLQEFGATPYFFSYDINGPLCEYINKKFKTTVLTDQIDSLSESDSQNDLRNSKIDMSQFDYVWVGGNTIPITFFQQYNSLKSIPKFIFIHMSQLTGFPLDAPLLPDFERKIASRILSIGEKTTESIYRILDDDQTIDYWYNPAPKEFRFIESRPGELKKIAVISSSHPTDEILKIKELLSTQGIEIDYIGRFNNNVKTVDASFYDQYDLIIGIGKNVKYSLVSGVPIYIYGRFGGSGYLNRDNYKKNSQMNFSGRGFKKKTTEIIAREITKGYQDSLRFHEENREAFIEDFSIDTVAEKLFKALEQEKRKHPIIETKELNWLISMQINILQRLQTASDVTVLKDHVKHLELDLADKEAALKKYHESNHKKIKKILKNKLSKVKKKLRF